MQIQRTLPPVLTPTAGAVGAQAGVDIPLGGEDPAAASPAAPGVVYSGASTGAAPEVPDLNSLSMEDQLKLGQRMGVFTKITYSRDGQMVSKPFTPSTAGSADPYAGLAKPEFLSGAVSTMRDFEEGMSVLKARAPTSDSASTGANFWSRSLGSVAARLNVFA